MSENCNKNDKLKENYGGKLEDRRKKDSKCDRQ